MDTHSLQITHDRRAHRFQTQLAAGLAVLDYHLKDGVMVITHTGVPQPFEGQGIAGKLTETALQHARTEGYRVAPVCPFAARYLDQHPEYQGLREEDKQPTER